MPLSSCASNLSGRIARVKNEKFKCPESFADGGVPSATNHQIFGLTELTERLFGHMYIA